MTLDTLLENPQFKEQVWSNLEEQLVSRCPYLKFFDLRRIDLEFDKDSDRWKIDNYGFLVLPMNQLYLNLNFENLDGGILAFQVSNRDGLEVFGQNSLILRVPTVKNLQKPLFHFIISNVIKLPILYSSKNVPLRTKVSNGVTNVLSYKNLENHF